MYVIDFTGANKSYIQTKKTYNNTNNYNYAMKCNVAYAYGIVVVDKGSLELPLKLTYIY
jgi:hypothetical protein